MIPDRPPDFQWGIFCPTGTYTDKFEWACPFPFIDRDQVVVFTALDLTSTKEEVNAAVAARRHMIELEAVYGPLCLTSPANAESDMLSGQREQDSGAAHSDSEKSDSVIDVQGSKGL